MRARRVVLVDPFGPLLLYITVHNIWLMQPKVNLYSTVQYSTVILMCVRSYLTPLIRPTNTLVQQSK
ncbi:hypothetical protein BCV70DRAFT_105291 [Testicularia cyperi]|uniref:Uncharacterized protein n=1 Tax=Testicularia cyperi TaxID=1882483 RepID=A0A317XQR8_9BASI|nr:hypothetical protein BCV70DRAFT_105291 [Testicularia cyperi]